MGDFTGGLIIGILFGFFIMWVLTPVDPRP